MHDGLEMLERYSRSSMLGDRSELAEVFRQTAFRQTACIAVAAATPCNWDECSNGSLRSTQPVSAKLVRNIRVCR
ncbi:hypothetical protein RB873 [Rhodopirellula baltica SH 1]|uniref:Uncharacterized protein n=1 Tax=Rhodopirellula baltica (strain DSM 10527 / NCIMB 13988 / SH1) TaxID=243090 RepID=Q7UY51_RHOBA|nr:hypothetical protein RB873 [Rhodopirellula baltica SH 1]